MKFLLILISTASFVVGAQAAESNALSLLLKSLENDVNREWSTAYPYCVSGSAQRWIFAPGCDVYFSRLTPESGIMQFGCPGMPQQNFDWNICGCTRSSIDRNTCTSRPDGLSLGTCKPSGSGDEFAVSYGCKDSYKKYKTGWLKAPCAEGELFNLDKCSCQESVAVDTATCASILGPILDCSPNDMPEKPTPPLTTYPWCVDDVEEQFRLNASLGCELFQTYKKDGEKCKGSCRQGKMFDWNNCKCAPEGQVDKVTCTSPPDALHLGTCSPTGSGELFAVSSGCQRYLQKSGSGWFKKSCAANLLFDLDQCICDFPYKVNASTCRSQSAAKRLLDLELAAELAHLF